MPEVCRICKRRPADEGMKSCAECRARHRATATARKNALRAMGRCTECGKETRLKADGVSRWAQCDACHANKRERYRRAKLRGAEWLSV